LRRCGLQICARAAEQAIDTDIEEIAHRKAVYHMGA
jgi:hypothetical protein